MLFQLKERKMTYCHKSIDPLSESKCSLDKDCIQLDQVNLLLASIAIHPKC